MQLVACLLQQKLQRKSSAAAEDELPGGSPVHELLPSEADRRLCTSSSMTPSALGTELSAEQPTASTEERVPLERWDLHRTPASPVSTVTQDEPQEGSFQDSLHVPHEASADLRPNSETSVTNKSKLPRAKPVALQKKMGGENPDADMATESNPVPKASYHFDPDTCQGNMNPFTTGGAKLQNSPPATQQGVALPGCRAQESGSGVAAEVTGRAVKLEFDFAEGTEDGEAKKALPKKSTRKAGSKWSPKRQRGGSNRPSEDAEKVLEVPLHKTPQPIDSSQWDDPNFDPFAGRSNVQSSPTLPKGSYNLDTADPFKPTKTLASAGADPCPAAADNSLNEILESQALVETGSASPKMATSRLIT